MLPPSAILASRGDALNALAVTLAHDPQYDWWDAYLRKRPTSRRRDGSAWAGRADAPASAPVAPKGRHASDTPELPGDHAGAVEQHGSDQPLGPSAARRGRHAADSLDERSTAPGPAALAGDEADVGALVSEAIESLSDKRLAFVLAGRLGVGADPLTLDALGQKPGVAPTSTARSEPVDVLGAHDFQRDQRCAGDLGRDGNCHVRGVRDVVGEEGHVGLRAAERRQRHGRVVRLQRLDELIIEASMSVRSNSIRALYSVSMGSPIVAAGGRWLRPSCRPGARTWTRKPAAGRPLGGPRRGRRRRGRAV